ncbi:MAG TPA: hypothetical protein VH397_01420 [Xanthobacteraceae bacterium]
MQPKASRAPQPISSPPVAAAASDRRDGHGPSSKRRRLAAVAAIAPRIIPKSVRLDVSVKTDSASARLPPSHCQKSAPDKSAPIAVAILPPHGEPEADAPRVAAGDEYDDREDADRERREQHRLGAALAPRRSAIAAITAAAAAMLASVAASPPHASRDWPATIGSVPPSA